MKKQSQSFDPAVFVLFGATGHLSANYLLPSLSELDARGALPENLKIVCVGRKDFSKETYLDFMVAKSKFLGGLKEAKARRHFLKHLSYYQADFVSPDSFKGLAHVLADHENKKGQCYNRLYYFATAPEFFSPIAKILKDSGLLVGCKDHERKVRVLVEKPFGSDLQSARKLNQVLLKYFSEKQIYRIDHYMGKETVQNLMVVRFANSIFEPLLNRDYVDHIEISVLEKDTVGSRGNFYDASGALKDVGQNHLLQILALSMMDEPKELHTELIRDQKLKILKSLIPFNESMVKKNIVRGQYEGYKKDAGRASKTETFIALKTGLSLSRWKDVPIYLRTGKAVARKVAEISFHFKEPLKCLFRGCDSNVLTLQIQPDERVHLQINSKVPGFGVDLKQINLEFGQKNQSEEKPAPAYDRLLLDFMQGDQRLFIRSDEIEAAWKFIDSISNNVELSPVKKYKIGSPGPKEADELIQKDMREWFTK